MSKRITENQKIAMNYLAAKEDLDNTRKELNEYSDLYISLIYLPCDNNPYGKITEDKVLYDAVCNLLENKEEMLQMAIKRQAVADLEQSLANAAKKVTTKKSGSEMANEIHEVFRINNSWTIHRKMIDLFVQLLLGQ